MQNSMDYEVDRMARITRRDFSSFDAYHDSGVATRDDLVAVIKEDGWIKADLSTECKRWKTVVHRFFSVLPDCAEWEEAIIESVEYGYWKQNDCIMGDGSRNPYPGYSWELEYLDDDLWYIHLNVKENMA